MKKNIVKNNKVSCVKKPNKKKVEKNTIYAFILLALFVFWTVGSAFGIMAFSKNKKQSNVVSASADEQLPSVINIIDSEYLVDNNFVSNPYLATAESSIVYNLVGIPSISISKESSGGECSFMFSSLSSKLQINVNYVFMFAIASPQDYTSAYYKLYMLNGAVQRTLFLNNGTFVKDGVTYRRYSTQFYYTGTGDSDFAFGIFNSLVGSVTLEFCQLYTIANSDNFAVDNPSYLYLKDYNAGFSDGLKQNISAYQSGIFENAKVSLWLGAVNGNPYLAFGDIPISNFMTENNNISLAKVPSYLRSIDVDPTLYNQSSFKFVVYFTKEIYPSMLNFTYVSHYDDLEEIGTSFYFNLKDYVTWDYLSFTREDYTIPYTYHVDSVSNMDFQGNYVDTLVIDGVFLLLTGNTSYIEDVSLQYSEGVTEGFDLGYSAALQNMQNELDKRYQEGISTGKVLGYNQGYNQGVESANEYTFTALISSVVDVPIRAFTSLFNFEVLGVNLANFFFALMTIALILAIVKLIL